MIVKGVILFLVFMAIVAMAGKFSLVWGWISGPKCARCRKQRSGRGACNCKERN